MVCTADIEFPFYAAKGCSARNGIRVMINLLKLCSREIDAESLFRT
jgi:hypothetical protein